jgi:hypothetical protein
VAYETGSISAFDERGRRVRTVLGLGHVAWALACPAGAGLSVLPGVVAANRPIDRLCHMLRLSRILDAHGNHTFRAARSEHDWHSRYRWLDAR